MIKKVRRNSDSRFVYWVGTVICSLLPICVAIGYWTFAPIHSGILVNFVFAFALAIFATNQVLKAKEDFQILRWPFALWVSSLIVVFALPFSIKHPEDFVFGWILASPLLMVAAYSLVQSRKPGGGNQLDIPVDLVHGFKRIGWRWITPPKYDFWLCWIGMLFPATLGVTLIAYNWNYPSNSWLVFLRVLGFGYLLWFALRWVTAPIKREKFRELVAATVGLRVVGIVYSFSLGVPNDAHKIARLAASCLTVIMLTGFFESAFRRSSERQTQSGIAEYEAVEAPSLGL
jgi:hypothetical protein